MPNTIQERYYRINKSIDKACFEAGRRREDVKLITVTKGHSAAEIIEVVNAGAAILGENYPEETAQKIDEIDKQVNPIWHMIGHLQSRKIKLMYPHIACIHSVDSLELAKKLDHFYEEKKSKIDILIEVNISGEQSKFGFDANNETKRGELLKTIEIIAGLSNLNPIGLMTMPPYALTQSQNEACYNLCRDYCSKIKENLKIRNFNQLSMGTSSDYETAIKCGATYVRIGEAIMGKRFYPEKNKG